MHELKLYKGVMCKALKNNAEIEEQLTCHFKIDIKNLTSFDSSSWESQKITL